MIKIISFFVAVKILFGLGQFTNGQSTSPFDPYCIRLEALLPQVTASSVNVTCTTPLVQETQVALNYCKQFQTSTFSDSTTQTFIESISGLTTGLESRYSECVNGIGTTTTTTTTLPPSPTLQPHFSRIVANITVLFNSSNLSPVGSCCLQPIQNDVQSLLNWSKSLMLGQLSQFLFPGMSYVQNVNNNIQNLYVNYSNCQNSGSCCNTNIVTVPAIADTTTTSVVTTTTSPVTTTVQETTTSSTTTTTVATTTKVAPSVCHSVFPVKTASNVYIKTACYIAQDLTNANAAAFCQNNGMTFYELTDADSVTAYQNYVNQLYPTTVGPTFAGNGIKNSNGNWVLYTKQTTPLYSDLVWGTPTSSSLTPCLVYMRDADNTFKAVAVYCTRAASFMCQYI